MAQVRDVVCGMMVDSENAEFQSEHEGETYYFCAPGCKKAFDENPEKYLGHNHGSHEGHEHSHH